MMTDMVMSCGDVVDQPPVAQVGVTRPLGYIPSHCKDFRH